MIVAAVMMLSIIGQFYDTNLLKIILHCQVKNMMFYSYETFIALVHLYAPVLTT